MDQEARRKLLAYVTLMNTLLFSGGLVQGWPPLQQELESGAPATPTTWPRRARALWVTAPSSS